MKKTIISLSIMMGLFTLIGLYQGNRNMVVNNVDNISMDRLDTSHGIFPMTEEPGEGLPK
ncbi:hypothetical protein IO99_12860 [Clostridium sulfidigenes]|uniref:Uncharacterized protein n=1 Tax=Clostridium sulfidigenes TaxID=318464 RepID=A0A084JA05_9CLOT|nr:hypothetical protein [Clostridium sulfidigenes]KEZ85789.1 hypothetical protein IO99_12860 [Clostridium sulfidigenes]HBA05087.1 hypothetical protein [Clostridium sp.]